MHVEQRRRPIAFAGLLLVFLSASSGSALIIDDFNAGSLTFVGPGASADTFVAGAMLGGERDEALVNISASGAIIAGMSASHFEYGAVNATGTATLTYDGSDGSAALNATGLGSVDFTEGGVNDVIVIEVLANDFVANLVLSVYTSVGDYSELTIATPGSIPAGPTAFLIAAFGDFIPVGLGADFTNVGAFSLLIDGSTEPQLGLTIGSIQAAEFAAVPEPAPGVLLLMGLVAITVGRRPQAHST